MSGPESMRWPILENGALIELLSALKHAHILRHQQQLLGQCVMNDDGSLTLPAANVEKWIHENERDYFTLSEAARSSIRQEVKRGLLMTMAAVENPDSIRRLNPDEIKKATNWVVNYDDFDVTVYTTPITPTTKFGPHLALSALSLLRKMRDPFQSGTDASIVEEILLGSSPRVFGGENWFKPAPETKFTQDALEMYLNVRRKRIHWDAEARKIIQSCVMHDRGYCLLLRDFDLETRVINYSREDAPAEMVKAIEGTFGHQREHFQRRIYKENSPALLAQLEIVANFRGVIPAVGVRNLLAVDLEKILSPQVVLPLDSWEEGVRKLIDSAACIIIFATKNVGPGLQRELELIHELGKDHQVVVVECPDPQYDIGWDHSGNELDDRRVVDWQSAYEGKVIPQNDPRLISKVLDLAFNLMGRAELTNATSNWTVPKATKNPINQSNIVPINDFLRENPDLQEKVQRLSGQIIHEELIRLALPSLELSTSQLSRYSDCLELYALYQSYVKQEDDLDLIDQLVEKDIGFSFQVLTSPEFEKLKKALNLFADVSDLAFEDCIIRCLSAFDMQKLSRDELMKIAYVSLEESYAKGEFDLRHRFIRNTYWRRFEAIVGMPEIAFRLISRYSDEDRSEQN